MVQERLTERAFWEEYWSKFEPGVVGRKTLFHDLFMQYPDARGATFVEVGGFPGTFAVYFKKYKGYNTTILDYFILPEIVHKMERINGLAEGSITQVEQDFFSFVSPVKYDVVLSAGFIEHFDNTEDVIKRHVALAKDNAKLFISLPNFTGINGWVQRMFHKDNYSVHNIRSMDPQLLKRICESLKLRNVKVFYYGRPIIWLEKTAPVNTLIKKTVKFVAAGMSLLPFRNRLLSPFIVITADR